MAETYHAEVQSHLRKVAADATQAANLVSEIERFGGDLLAASRTSRVNSVKGHSCGDPSCPVSNYSGNAAP